MNHKIQKITMISDKEDTKVFLASEENTSQLFILKEVYGEDITALYHQFQELHSPFFPKIYDVFFEDGRTTILEQYIEGETLSQKIKDHNLREEEILPIMDELCQALAVLHSSSPSIIHRDVKPENIIITPKGNLKLIDIDAARVHKTASDKDTRLLGTRGYASPEQYGFAQTDARSDIYSAGIVFQELMENGISNDVMKKRAQHIIDKSTMFDPDKRYSDISHMRKDILKLKKNRKQNILLLSLSACVVILIGVTAALGTRKPTVYYITETAEKEISTASAYASSFKAQCEENTLFVYLGHPYPLEISQSGDEKWLTTDDTVVSVDDGILTGWKEGTAEIICTDPEGTEIDRWQVAVTTLNDGKDATTYMETDSAYFSGLSSRRISPDLNLAQAKVNTLNDAISFMKAIGIVYDRDAPIKIHDYWLWNMSASSVIDFRKCGLGDFADLVAYLLQYDYEDMGFIIVNGLYGGVLNWCYEDGFYYLFDYMDLFYGSCGEYGYNIPYTIMKFSSVAEMSDYIVSADIFSTDNVALITMVSAQNHTFQPPNYMSYIHGSEIFGVPIKIGFESKVFNNMQILYQSDRADIELVSFELDEIPLDVPTYEKRPYYR